eukprot:TRINITY_DN64075_c0_g1_i1.p1 TRINITY_DN64075_c0_g1~~TRINITY_DN64075_c0_g1_i1.p1  ORF type:complete len:206 (-),score=35.57 TRINITY_DN64075_c0_g1_i1:106-723(-)
MARCFIALLFLTFTSFTFGKKHEVLCETTAGDFKIEVTDEWSPIGVTRFLELVRANFFDDQIVYRVIPGFIAQFGVAADPLVQQEWQDKTIADEPKMQRFRHGTLSFAGNGQDSRTCHFFLTLAPHGTALGRSPHETPLGQVTDGFDVLLKLQEQYKRTGYGDLSFLQRDLVERGNDAAKQYPSLDRIKTCRLGATTELKKQLEF